MRKLNHIYKIKIKKQIVYCKVVNELSRGIIKSVCDGCYFLGKLGCTAKNLKPTCATTIGAHVYKRSML